MSDLVFHLVLFAVAGVVMVAAPLIIGMILRPKNPTPEKDAVYECGEPTIGSSFVQFDLRFYTVALLFIVFDVEVAFFFPWTAMYGNTMQLTDTDLPPEARIELSEKLLNISDTRPEVHGHALGVLKNKARLQAASEDGRTVGQSILDSVNARNDEFWQVAEKRIARRVLTEMKGPGDDGDHVFAAADVDAMLESLTMPISESLALTHSERDYEGEALAVRTFLDPVNRAFDDSSSDAKSNHVDILIDNAISDESFESFLAVKQEALIDALAAELDVEKSEITSRYISAADARSFGWLAFADIAVFFGVLMVGFAYVWKRGDLEWVRAVS